MSATVLQGALLIGDVQLGDDASVWYNSVIRADIGRIRVGARSNIQDNCVLHIATGGALNIGEGVTVGHSCILHGCTIEDDAFVGMGCIVMDGAVLKAGCMLGAGSLVTGGSEIPAGMLAVGRPAKVVRALTPQELAQNREHAGQYAEMAKTQPTPEPKA